jgi:hypothetical protein
MTQIESIELWPGINLEVEKENGIVVAYWKNGKRLNYTLLGGRK